MTNHESADEALRTAGVEGQSIVAYRNKNTSDVYVFDTENAELEARPNFERTNVDDIPRSTLHAALRARAERAAIEASASLHAQRVELAGKEAAAAAKAAATSADPAGAVVVTGAHALPESVGDGTGVLSRYGVDHVNYPGAPDNSREALLERDRQDRELGGNAGVLARAEAARKVDKSKPGAGVLLDDANDADAARADLPDADPTDETPATSADADGEPDDQDDEPADDTKAVARGRKAPAKATPAGKTVAAKS